ncbi:MAG: SagB/ThcOx family dehydrogenase [Phycisphaerales bacterium]|nr:SagB/ThcOx family dehydrogenase [Phycisphaerales bacterium]
MVSTSGVCEDGNTASLVALPPAAMKGTMSLEEAIAQRRSVRKFTDAPLSIEQVGRLCWAGQGITEPRRGLRASPSAGALYPIDIYVVTAEGVDQYQPDPHGLRRHLAGDMRPALRRAALNQEVLSEAPVCLVIAAVPQKLAQRYGQRSMRYCLIEAGHVAQNILLQATALGLAGVPVGAFEDAQVAEVLKFPSGTEVLYLLPIGNPRT